MIYIIIPVHNRLPYTINCLNSIKLSVKSEYSIIIVDDGSTDGTSTYIKNNYPDVHVVKGNGDLFWTGSMRVGIESALKMTKSSDHIMSLNNPTSSKYSILCSTFSVSLRLIIIFWIFFFSVFFILSNICFPK